MKTFKGIKMSSELSPNFIEDLGMRFAKETSKTKERYWLVKCSCCDKVYETMKSSALRSGFECKSCATVKKRTSHNESKTRMYRIHDSMKQRCGNENHTKFKHYGGRGIKICKEWENDYVSFRDWSLSNGYSENLTIDRINNDDGYSPDNCRWVGNNIQRRNTVRLKSTNTSGYRGLTKHNHSGKWQVRIMVDKKQISIGYFSDKIEAAKAYDRYVIDNNLEHTTNFS